MERIRLKVGDARLPYNFGEAGALISNEGVGVVFYADEREAPVEGSILPGAGATLYGVQHLWSTTDTQVRLVPNAGVSVNSLVGRVAALEALQTFAPEPSGIALTDTAALGAALSSMGSGTLNLRAGTHSVRRGLDGRGKSVLRIRGAGIDATTVVATNEFDGSDNDTRNAVFNFNNSTATIPNYPRMLVIEDMTIDCTAQNASGVPGGATFGYNLCAVECQNIDRVLFRRVRFIKAFGNAIAIASIDPGVSTAVVDATIEDCIFEDCVQGTLPQYGNIAGSVIQLGAMVSAEVHRCKSYRAGGPFVDAFNAVGVNIHHNYLEGVASTPIGAGQTMNSIRSDFGLRYCSIHENILNSAGVIQLNGIMTPNALNDMLGTPGPFGTHVHHNRIFGTGSTAYAAPTIAASTTTYNNTSGAPMLVTVTGGAGVNVLINGVVTVGSGQSARQWRVPTGGAIRLDYSSAPTWTWQRAPNASLPAIGLLAGNAAAMVLGLVDVTPVTDNIIVDVPTSAIQLYDGRRCLVKSNTVRNAAEWSFGYPAIQLLDSNVVAGGGTQECDFEDNKVFDTRTVPCIGSAFQTNTANNVNNTFRGNRIPSGVIGIDTTVARTQYIWKDNYDAASKFVRAATPVIASAGTIVLPDVGGDTYIISGTTSITGVLLQNPDRLVTLIFQSGLTVFANSQVKIGSNFVATADDTLQLVGDGINVYQAGGRSVN